MTALRLLVLLACAVLPVNAWADAPVALRATVQAWQAPADVSVTTAETPDHGLEIALQRGPERVRVLLARRPHDGNAHGGVLLGSLLWLTDPRQPGPTWQSTLDALQQRVQQADHGQFAEAAPPATSAPPVPPPPLLLAQTWLLLALSLWALPWGLWRALRELPGAKRLWLLGLLAAWGLRAAAPHRLVMVHFGWLHLDQAAILTELPRYGPATTLLDHALFWAVPPSTAAIQWLHTALGTLTLLPMAAWAGRLGGAKSAILLGIAAAVWPAAWLDHGSESMLVPAMLWWATGALLLDDFLREHRWFDGIAAAVLLLLCGLSRPDCLLLAVPTALLLCAARPGCSWRSSKLLIWLAFVAVLLLPDAQFIRDRAAEDVAKGNLPRLAPSFVWLLPRRLLDGWLALRPSWFPLTWTALALFGLLARTGRRRAVAALWLGALLWAVPMLVDFNETSVLRLHMPSAWWIVLAAAVMAADVRTRLRHTWQIQGLYVAALLPALATAPAVLAPQNSDASEVVVAAAADLARDGKPTALVVRTYDDEPAFGVHLFWPQALLEPGDRWVSVRDWQAGRVPADTRVLGVIDIRCWAELRSQPVAATLPDGLHPACKTLLQRAAGKPLWQQTFLNVGERGFDWYAPSAQLPAIDQRIVRLRPP